MEHQAFIEKIAACAIEDAKTSKILPSLTIAQAIIESNWGNSGLTAKANNLFGMKGTYNGASVTMKTKEYVDGRYIVVDAKFRKYPSWLESIKDHSALFNRLSRYKNLRGCTDYKLACKYIKEDGYATSPTYTQTLINCIEKHNLVKYDEIYLGRENVEESSGTNVEVSREEYDMPTIKLESKGKTVKVWQIIVGVEPDGIFGPNTLEATKSFQKKKNLVVDGIVGPKSWNAGLNDLR